MKKILYIHHGKGLGGAGLSLLHLVRALDKTKYHPIVLFLCADQGLIDLYQSYGIETVGSLNLIDCSHTVMQWYRWHQVKEVIKVLRSTIRTWWSIADDWYDKIKPDIVHVNTSSLTAWMHRAYKRGIPVVCHIREPLAPGYFGLRRYLVKEAIGRWATTIVAISQNEALPWRGLEKTHVVYNAVDPEWFNGRIHTKTGKQPTILFLGGLAPEKGTLTILQAFSELIKGSHLVPHTKLVIAGYFQAHYYPWWHPRSFSYEQKYHHQVETLVKKLGTAVEIVGSRSDVPALMAQSDVIVFPATVGHFARPIIEAGFMAKPVVSSALSPLDELVLDGVTGFLVPPADIQQWAQKLGLLLADQERAQNMGNQAYEFCRKNFELSEQTKKIESLYKV